MPRQNSIETPRPRRRLSRLSMSKEDHSAGRLDVPVQRGFYKTKPGSTFGSHWDPEKVHKVPGYRDPAVYQTKMKERQAALKSQGQAHIPNRHAIQKAAVKQETARTARKRRSPKVKVNRTRPIFAEGQRHGVTGDARNTWTLLGSRYITLYNHLDSFGL